MGTRTRACALAMIALLAWAGAARANSGTQLPLNQYQAGTETAFIVPNGNFEAVSSGDATGWTETPAGGMQAATPVNTQGQGSWFGNFAAQSTAANARYSQSISVSPNTSYTLSGYIWNFGQAGGGPNDDDLALIELRDGTTLVKNVALERVASDSGDGANGYFLYDTFTTGPSMTTLDLAVIFDDQVTGGSLPAVTAQFDNVGLTPSAQFVPPSQIPEPGAMSALAVGGLALLRRRRH